jgi:hypothetical protein
MKNTSEIQISFPYVIKQIDHAIDYLQRARRIYVEEQARHQSDFQVNPGAMKEAQAACRDAGISVDYLAKLNWEIVTEK